MSGAQGSGASAPAPNPAAASKVTRPVQQEFDFEGDVIESEYLRPNSAMVETVKKRAGLSLVRIKTSFLEKIATSLWRPVGRFWAFFLVVKKSSFFSESRVPEGPHA